MGERFFLVTATSFSLSRRLARHRDVSRVGTVRIGTTRTGAARSRNRAIACLARCDLMLQVPHPASADSLKLSQSHPGKSHSRQAPLRPSPAPRDSRLLPALRLRPCTSFRAGLWRDALGLPL